MTRRQLLWAATGAGLGGWGAHALAHEGLGPVTPALPAPGLPLVLHTGERHSLAAVLRGRYTAVQLMFTGCSAVCPIQGAVFASLQQRLATSLPQAQLLSLSIDPLGDDAPALAAWLKRFGAGPQWRAGVPPVRHADVMLDFVKGRSSTPTDWHTAQVTLFDRQGRLAFKCAELASAGDIELAILGLARQG